ncbi:MAG: M60 family metallopeptidase, partial [Bacteroidaceae bacterium]|nr:M60 family metallopeptidase [Bacteroidaceae bacterium]
MRNTNVWRLIFSLLLLSPFVGGLTWAQISNGKVYNFVNVANSGSSMTSTAGTNVSIAATLTSDYKQLWYVEEVSSGVYTLRNLGNGKYLRSSNATSGPWSMVSSIDDNCKFACSTVGTGYTLRATNSGSGYGYMHYGAGQGCVVCWESGAEATQWTISEVIVSASDLEDNWAELDALNNTSANVGNYQTALNALFTDQSCSTLNATYAAYTTAQMLADNNYKALPATLQAMVLKMTTDGTWEEANYDSGKSPWGADYAKKYRVQLYEPYNEVGEASSALGLNAHTNINNPTGIFVNNRGTVYVMVEGTIKDGASLYLTYYTGHGKLGNSYSDGVELHEGLNIVPYYADNCNLCINYVVHTFDTSDGKRGNQAKVRKLSDYADLKIHIEGGYINGYYNKMGDELYGSGDKSADWDYIEARATQKDVTVLGQYMTLQFPLNDADTEGNKGLGSYFNELVNIEPVIDEWDNVMLWERLVLGILDKETIEGNAKKSPYSDKDYVFAYTGDDTDGFGTDYGDYYNVHGLAFGVGGDAYMYGGWDHCGYHYNTMGGVILNLPTDAGSHWGPGHEIGHQHQELLNMRGLTEVTNNLFANVVLWYFGETTSRYNGNQGSLTNVLEQYNAEGTDFFSNNIWAQTIMYYKLFLYYHVLGNNPKFYPRLFEMLRQDPMNIAYEQDGSKCLMHFYKKCCLASGDDLTEFFRAHGFFEVMENRFVGDYSSAVYNLTQNQIDAAIEEVKSWGYPENLAVLFVNDATGETIKSYKGDNLELYGETTVCAEVGSYASFATATKPSYNYAISGNTVTMEGSGGVGFAILNENGELIGFSDKKTFEISAEAVAAIASGKASVVTLNADNTPVAATNVMDTDNTEAKYELLGELLGSAKQLLDLSDETGTKVGYYRASSLTNLQEAYKSAKAVYDAQTIAAYSAVYDVLYQEYANLINNEYARINITEGYAYRLTNKAYPNRSMSVQTSGSVNEMCGLETVANNDAQLWYFEAGATPGTYYLKNKATSLYPGDVSTGAVLKADKSDKTTDNGAHAYHLQNMGNGVFALVGGTGLHCSASQSYNIVGWGADADATQWYITAEVVDETIEARLKLEETIAKTEALVNEMAEVKIKGRALDLTTCTITSNTPETGHETKYLVDGNPETFFHTNWTGTAISENHNFIIDLGEGNSLEQFAFNYITLPNSANNVDAPKTMVIEGSTNGTDYTSITSLSGLPTTKGTTYASTTLGTKGTAYRYLRFSVTDATGGKLGSYYYFGLAEFGLTNMQTELLSVKDGYSSSQTAILNACDGLYAANLVYNNETATQEELQAAASALNAYYETLLEAYNENAGLEAKKKELQTLINKTTVLIGECGEVNYTPAMFDGEAPLQVTDANGKFYLSTNAQSNQEGPISGLVDGVVENANSSTYFHTDYSGSNSTDGLDHYIQVKLGEKVKAFQFTYTNRYNTDKNYATKMTIWGSTDGTTFEEITRLEGLPAQASAVYTSEQINITKEYTHLRFMVTESDNSVKKGGHHFFHMAEFDLTLIGGPETYTVQLNQNIGEVTEDLLLATYKENEEAKSTFNYATTELQVINAIADLQAQYEALEAAKKVVDKSGLIQLIATATEKLAACGTVTPNGDVLDVTLNESNAGSVNKNMLRDLYSAIENAQGVIDNTKATQEEVDAEIAELTAQIEVVQTAKNSTAKADLKTAIDDAQTAIDACASSITKDGDAYTVVWKSETAGDVDKATLIAAYEALAQANAVYNGDASAVSEYQAAKEALNTPIATLNEYKEGYHKAQLKSMVDLLTALIEKCNTEGQGDLTAGMLEEMVQINETA